MKLYLLTKNTEHEFVHGLVAMNSFTVKRSVMRMHRTMGPHDTHQAAFAGRINQPNSACEIEKNPL